MAASLNNEQKCFLYEKDKINHLRRLYENSTFIRIYSRYLRDLVSQNATTSKAKALQRIERYWQKYCQKHGYNYQKGIKSP